LYGSGGVIPVPIVAKHLSLREHGWCVAGIGGYLRDDSCAPVPRTDAEAPREETVNDGVGTRTRDVPEPLVSGVDVFAEADRIHISVWTACGEDHNVAGKAGNSYE
jgi:hypothetical protein